MKFNTYLLIYYASITILVNSSNKLLVSVLNLLEQVQNPDQWIFSGGSIGVHYRISYETSFNVYNRRNIIIYEHLKKMNNTNENIITCLLM